MKTKTSLDRIANQTCGSGFAATLMALLLPTAASAQITSFTSDGWLNGVPVLGMFTSDGRLNVTGSFPNRTTTLWESYCWGVGFTPAWTVPDGLTREWRTDLVSLDENGANPIVATLAVGTTAEGVYVFQKSRDFAYLWKWVPGPNVLAVLAGDPTPVRNTNVVLALALTRVEPNVVITARVLDKADPNLLAQGVPAARQAAWLAVSRGDRSVASRHMSNRKPFPRGVSLRAVDEQVCRHLEPVR